MTFEEFVDTRIGNCIAAGIQNFQLFEAGENINDPEVLESLAGEFGWRRGELAAQLEDKELRRLVAEQFSKAGSYGTNALPAVLVDDGSERKLLLGGYADSAMLVELLSERLD